MLFRDITTLLVDARGFRKAVDALVEPYAGVSIDKVAGIEARGFILGGAIAHQLGCGFIPVRKAGGQVVAACFVIDLPDLGGSERVRRTGVDVITLCALESGETVPAS